MSMTKAELLDSFTNQVKNAIALQDLTVSEQDVQYLAQHLLICYSVGYREDRIAQELARMLSYVKDTE